MADFTPIRPDLLNQVTAFGQGLRADVVSKIGLKLPNLTKPDGTGLSLSPASLTNINTGSATRTTGQQPPRPTDAVADGKSNTETDPTKNSAYGKNLSNISPNPLEKFASFTPVWTLACLTPKQFNNPPSYRNNTADLTNIVLSSAGRFESQRVKTAGGIPEFYINNFTMKATIAANEKTGNSNAFKFEWDIFEPYSMGTLLQSLQLAALNAGYINYLDNAPYVLRLDFMGWDELGREYTTVKPKFFVLKLTGVKFSVTESGSNYKMEGIPYNHHGFSDVTNTTFKDIKIIAGKIGNVKEALGDSDNPNSLMSILNNNEIGMVEKKLIKFPDIYDIQFPSNSSEFDSANPIKTETRATANPEEKPKQVIKGTALEVRTSFTENPISTASFGFDQKDGGNFPFKKHGDQVDDKTGLVKRDQMVIDPKNRTFQFSQGQSLTAIINQIILSSDYAKSAIKTENMVDGFIKWFRLDLQIELLDYDDLVGDFARKITFRVVPFLVHHTIFANPSAAPIGYKEIEKKIVKEYNYIYTGQNVDVLKFDIQINNLFYSGNTASAPNQTGKAADPNTAGTAGNPNTVAVPGKGAAAETTQSANLGRSRPKRNPELLEKAKGGSGTTTTEQHVAELFQNAFVSGSSADQIKVSIDILGDPYWMVDSGMSNYFAKSSNPQSQTNDDGTMNYESGDVFVYLSFRTPVDVNETSMLYDFSVGGKESPFSGIYRVIMCENKFQDGHFVQKLDCLRMPGPQPADKDKSSAAVEAIDKANSGRMTVKGQEPQKTNPAADPDYTGYDA